MRSLVILMTFFQISTATTLVGYKLNPQQNKLGCHDYDKVCLFFCQFFFHNFFEVLLFLVEDWRMCEQPRVDEKILQIVVWCLQLSWYDRQQTHLR